MVHLEVLDPLVDPEVHDDQDHEGTEDVEEEVHPEDVDSNVVRVRPQRGRPQVDEGQVGCQVPGARARVCPHGDVVGRQLEVLGDVVGHAEEDDRDDEGFGRVDLPEKFILYWATPLNPQSKELFSV